jgi:hypothetical protein
MSLSNTYCIWFTVGYFTSSSDRTVLVGAEPPDVAVQWHAVYA